MLSILGITGPIFLVIAVGFITVRFGLLSKSDVAGMGTFVIYCALPALLFRALSQRSLDEIVNIDYLAAYAGGSVAMMAVGMAIARWGSGKDFRACVMVGVGMSSSNSGYVGYPIVVQILGPMAATILALNMLVENLLMIPLTIALAEGGGGGSWLAVLKRSAVQVLRSPIVLSIIAGTLSAVTGVHPPAPVAKAIDMLASASGPVALLVIGGVLVGLEIKGMVREVSLITLGKLIGHPLAVLAAMMLVQPADPVWIAAGVLSAAMPMMGIYPIFGRKYGTQEMCAAALLAATAVSFFTLSGLIWWLTARGMMSVY